MASSRGKSSRKVMVHNVPMKATIYLKHRLVMVTGSIVTNKNDIQVRIPKLPSGRWKIVRAQVNYTNKRWMAWQIAFGDNTRIVETGNAVASRQFTKFCVLPKHNALVLYDGEVIPGEPLLKMFEVDQINEGNLVMTYHGTFEKPSTEQVKEGFPQRPIESFDLDAEYIV